MDGKLLADLKVTELKIELENRELDKNGVKQVLIDRLKEALVSEGHEVTSFKFAYSKEITTPRAKNLPMDSDENRNFEQSSSENQSEDLKTMAVTAETAALESSEEAVDPVPFVVQVEPEEDLDYDISNDEAAKNTHNEKKEVEESKLKEKGKENESIVEQATDESSLRVRNLTVSTKAVDLKQHFSAHGKVVSAKILANTRTPGGCCGFVKMASSEDAASCILNLDGTEFNGNVIQIEVSDKEPTLQPTLKTVSSLIKPSNTYLAIKKRQRRRVRAFQGSDYHQAPNVMSNPPRSFNRNLYIASQLARSVNRASRYLARPAKPMAVEYTKRRIMDFERPQNIISTVRRPYYQRSYPSNIYVSRETVRVIPKPQQNLPVESRPRPRIPAKFAAKWGEGARLQQNYSGISKEKRFPAGFREGTYYRRPADKEVVYTRQVPSIAAAVVSSLNTFRSPGAPAPRVSSDRHSFGREMTETHKRYESPVTSGRYHSPGNRGNFNSSPMSRGRFNNDNREQYEFTNGNRVQYENNNRGRNSLPSAGYKSFTQRQSPIQSNYGSQYSCSRSSDSYRPEQRQSRVEQPSFTSRHYSSTALQSQQRYSSRSRSPISPLLTMRQSHHQQQSISHSTSAYQHQNRREQEPQPFRRASLPSNNYMTSNNHSSSNEPYFRRNGVQSNNYGAGMSSNQMRTSQRGTPTKKFSNSSSVIDYGHRSGNSSSQWQSPSSSLYSGNTGTQWRSNYQSRTSNY